MKKTKTILLLALTQGFVMQAHAAKDFRMGYGGNSCGEVAKVMQSGDAAQIGQVARWILG